MIDVTVVYKSGAMLTFKCEEFSTGRNSVDGGLTSVSADGIPEGSFKPMVWGIDEIAAIWTKDAGGDG